MKGYLAYYSWFIIAILTINLTVSKGDKFEVDLYEEGILQLEKGEWKQALNIWLKAKSEIGLEKKADPRIGTAFIDVVTQYEAKEYYEVADQMYFWGLKGVDVHKFSQELQDELNRLKPIIGKELADTLQKLLDQKSPLFSTGVIEYWIRQDPFPGSSYNERLLEHWERIQYARNKFNLSKNTPYETDDRGLIYIRFGAPDDIKVRSVSVNRVIDPVSGTSIPILNNISVHAEIWYYSNLIKEETFTSFTFGRPGNGGSFGLQPGILSLVPVAGNRISNYYDEQKVLTQNLSQSSFGGSAGGTQFDNTGGGLFVPPGYTRVTREGGELMLKYAVLEEIGAIDRFYSEMYNKMTTDIIRASKRSSDEKFTESARQNLNKYDHSEIVSSILRDRTIPATVTETQSELEKLNLNHLFLRFMDSSFNTIYMMATEAVDFQPIHAYFSYKDYQPQVGEVFQMNTLYEYDQNWNLVIEQPHVLPLNSEGHFGKGIYYFGEYVHDKNILFSTQYLDKNPELEDKRLHEKLGAHIIASSEANELSFPPPLRLEGEDQVQISDILIARMQEEVQGQRIPFVPSLDRTFEKGESMLVYFEVYNLPKGKDYRIEYLIKGIDKKGRTQKIGHSIILNYSSSGLVNANWFEVSRVDLPQYKSYQLSLIFHPLNSDHKISSSVKFNVTD